MKKYGSGKITEPQDLDVFEDSFEKTASTLWTPQDSHELAEELDDHDDSVRD